MTILAVDEHPVIRLGLSHALQGLGRVIGAGSEDELDQIEDDVDVAIIHMEREGVFVGSRLARLISERWTKVKICFFTGMDEGHYASLAHQAGYHGWLHKSADTDLICQAVRHIAAGDVWFMDEDLERSSQFGVAKFTHREREVLILLSIGVTRDDDLAKVLGVTRNTIKAHLYNVRNRIGLQTKGDVLQYAVSRSVFF